MGPEALIIGYLDPLGPATVGASIITNHVINSHSIRYLKDAFE